VTVTRSLGLWKDDAMSTLPIAMTVGAATGWVVCSCVYGQLSQAFKQAKPLMAASLAGSISGIVVLAIVSAIVHIMST
jgi:sulfite exporter TauE/SafE